MSWWLPIRLAGIALGIVTLLGFASGYLNVEFKPYFESVLKVMQEVASVVVGAPLWDMLLEWLRQHFAWVPTPEPHWKPIYTLSALLMLSTVRHGEPWYAVPIALTCSVIPAIFAGTMPVGSLVVALWPLAGFVALVAILGALRRGSWEGADTSICFIAAAIAAAGYYSGVNSDGAVSILVLTALVGGFGLLALLYGLFTTRGTLAARLSQPSTATGLDITATLGVALLLGYLFAV